VAAASRTAAAKARNLIVAHPACRTRDGNPGHDLTMQVQNRRRDAPHPLGLFLVIDGVAALPGQRHVRLDGVAIGQGALREPLQACRRQGTRSRLGRHLGKQGLADPRRVHR
jgi:hypothetical protein